MLVQNNGRDNFIGQPKNVFDAPTSRPVAAGPVAACYPCWKTYNFLHGRYIAKILMFFSCFLRIYENL